MKKANSSPSLKYKPTVVSLFSGCGGLDYGALAAGCDVIYANDISKDAISSLRKLIPDAETYVGSCGDIKKLPKADIVCGGYPCQSFSMGGRRSPSSDSRTLLYKDFLRVVGMVKPKFFVVENVPGLVSLDDGKHFKRQLRDLSRVGNGYHVSWMKMDASDFGVPQKRKRVLIVGVRNDLGLKYVFPNPAPRPVDDQGVLVGHGAIISKLPSWPAGDFYERSGGEEDNFPWYYMSRNRRADAIAPSYTIVANWRHTPLHPASPLMTLTWSNLSDGWKQRWDFSDGYDPSLEALGLVPLERARRLSWMECSVIQSFPTNFEPVGSVQSKFQQLGNAVPPLLAKAVFEGIVNRAALHPV